MAVIGNLISLMSMPGTLTIGGIAVNGFFGRLLMTVAVSALQAAMASKPRTPGIKTSTTASGGTNPCSFIVGRYATGGSMAAPAMSHSRAGGSENTYLNYVIELGDVPGQTLETLFIDGNAVDFGETPHEDYGLPVLGMYEGYAWIKYYDGTQTVVDPMLLAKYADHPERPWSADMVGTGLCYAILTFKYNREVFNSLPRVRFEMAGIPLYDPRLDSSVGGSGPQRWSDKSTWTASTNIAVQIYNIKRGIELPDGNVWGGQVPASDLPLDVWFAAMNECDITAELAGGGTEPQWRAGYEITVDEEPSKVIQELLKGCGGKVAEVGGVWSIRIGATPLPVYFFTDEHVVVSRPQDLAPFPSLAQTYNAVQATYPDPASGWETTDAPPRYDAAYEAEDLNKRLVADLSLPAVPFGDQVQRVMHAYLEDQRRFRRHILTLPPAAALLEPLDVVSWTSARNGYDGKHFELAEQANSIRSCLQRVSLREVDQGDYDWQPALTLPSSPTAPGWSLPSPQAVTGFSAVAGALSDASATDRRPAIYLTWDGGLGDTTAGIRWEIRLTATAQVVLRGSTQDVSAGGYVVSDGVLPVTGYDARARLVQSAPSEWTGWVSLTTPDVRLGAADLAQSITDEIATARAEAQAADALAQQVLTDATAATAALRSDVEAAVGGLAAVPSLIDRVTDFGEGVTRLTAERDLRIPRELETAEQLRTIAETVSDLLVRFGTTQSVIAEAGIYIDPVQGRARIEAVSRIDQTLSEVSVTLDALAASIELRATHTEVNQVVSNAVLDPAQVPIIDELQAQVNSVSLSLSALEAALELKADSTTVSGIEATLTQVGLDIDAIEVSLSQFVTQTNFDALGAQVTSVEQTLSGFDGARYQLALSDIRSLSSDLDESTIGSIEALLAAHEGRETLRTDLAYAAQDFRALVDEDRASIASLTTELGVAFENAVALVVQESEARASADEAEATARLLLSAGIDAASAAISQETTARANADSALGIRIDTVEASASGNAAAISTEVQARADADGALAGRLDIVEAAADGNKALITSETVARSNADGALGARIDTIEVTAGNNAAAITAESLARSNADGALGARIDTVEATAGSLSATVTTQSTAIATLEGQLSASFVARAVAGSQESALELIAASDVGDPNAQRSGARLVGANITLDGDVNVTGSFWTSTLFSQNAWIQTAMIADAQVDTLRIAGNAVTVDAVADKNVQIQGVGYTSSSDPWITYMQIDLTLAEEAQAVVVDAVLVMTGDTTAHAGTKWSARIVRQATGGVLHSVGGDMRQQSLYLRGISAAVLKGTHTFLLQYRLGTGLGIENSSMTASVKYR